jgi:hypothetical protein
MSEFMLTASMKVKTTTAEELEKLEADETARFNKEVEEARSQTISVY